MSGAARCMVRCCLLLACGALAAPRGLAGLTMDAPSPLALQAIDAPPPDQESYGLLLPRLTAKYRPSQSWDGVTDPRLYVLTEMENMQEQEEQMRAKRNRPSLSIVNPVDVLRQRLLLEIARKQMQDNEIQAEKNRAFFKNIGKRSGSFLPRGAAL